MTESPSKYILGLIEEGEHESLDFKFEISSARKIAITLVAFANTSGGRILIGVKDNGRVSGIRSDEEYYMIESAANNFCKPVIRFTSRVWTIDGKTVLEIHVPEVRSKPHFVKDENDRWKAYLRIRDQNFLADPVIMKLWKQKDVKIGSLIEFSRSEKLLLNYLEINPEATLQEIIKDTGFNKNRLTDLLVKLISFGVVEFEIREKGSFYSLVESPGSAGFKNG